MRRFATRYVPSPFALVFKELPIAILVTSRVRNSKPVAFWILTEQWLMVEQDTFGVAWQQLSWESRTPATGRRCEHEALFIREKLCHRRCVRTHQCAGRRAEIP